MLKITEQNFQTKENDRFVSSLLFKQLQQQETNNYHPSSGTAAMPCPLYDGGVSVAVPFVWESKPGTPKHPSLGQSPGLPPLTPPPAYSYQQQHQPSNKKPVKLKRRLKLLLLPEFWKSLPKFVLCIRGIITRKVVGGGSRSSSSTVAASGRTDNSISSRGAARTDQRSTPLTPARSKRYRMSSSSSRSKTNRVTRKSKPLAGYLASKEDDDYEEENAVVVKESTRRSSNSNLCFSFW